MTEYAILYLSSSSPKTSLSRNKSLDYRLVADICILINVEGSFKEDEIAELSKGYHCTNGQFSVSYKNIATFLYKFMIKECLYNRHLIHCRRRMLSVQLVDFFLLLWMGIIEIQAE